MTLSWAKIRKAWAIAGSTALVIFVGWSLLAFRANATAREALRSDDEVSVHIAAEAWTFEPANPTAGTASLLFFPGGLVDPAAYAPLMRTVAENGHRALIVPLPRRGAFGGAEDPAVLRSARALIDGHDTRWIVAGHSKGGKVAAMFAHAHPGEVDGLVLLGTSHPRDVDLADAPFPVLQVLGDRDPIASLARADRNRHKLPATTSRVVIAGGNHSQFGDYGFQPGDRFATMPRQEQRRRAARVLLDALEGADRPRAPSTNVTEHTR
ncbi:alpha/beta family hydrolase [Luteimonas saliphila]|uniref:alpha/beta family hydrolase n=1 Tax=Luteimonas saliphila TaxID=2804919 RepID=UPI00192D78E9|nr:alpha/beta family hydrolase [Luteimonas saliphila]